MRALLLAVGKRRQLPLSQAVQSNLVQRRIDKSLRSRAAAIAGQYYRPYAIPGSSTDGTTQNDVLFSSPGPGTVYKAGLKIHLGGA
jgi:hypothetical protein